MNPYLKSLLATAFVVLTFLPSQASVCGWPFRSYCQEFDQTGNAYSSQNDTNEFGVFAQTYDNIRLGGALSGIRFEGEYYNPPSQGQITGWTVAVYADVAGQPGAVLFAQHTVGTGGETFDGNFGGFPTYVYTLNLPFWFLDGTQHWISLYPDLGFPPQWGWSSGSGGDGISYQDFFGARAQLDADMAFALSACNGCVCGFCGETPEPGTLLMVGTGAASAGAYYADALGLSALGLLRRKLRSRKSVLLNK